MKRKIIVIVALAVVVSGFMPNATGENDTIMMNYESSQTEAYTVVSPFRINNNSDFASSPRVTSGNGNITDPWIIEGYEINGTGYGYCIYVGDTTDYFIVRNCSLHHASGVGSTQYYNSGLILYNNTHGLAIDNVLAHNEYDGIFTIFSGNHSIKNNIANDNGMEGIEVAHTTSTIITGNEAYNNTFGVSVKNSNKIIVRQNIATNNTHGIAVGALSNNCTIEYNLLRNNSYYGVSLSAGNNLIINNTISESGERGIDCYICTNNTIKNNTIINNSWAVLIYKGSNHSIVGNNISFNDWGLFLDSSEGNTVYNNRFINDTGYNAYDTNGNNQWDGGYPEGGNFWSSYSGSDVKSGPLQDISSPDGFGDTPYYVDGYAGTKDRYPLMEPNPPISPASCIHQLTPYWQRANATISADAGDIGSGVANVTLGYQYSSDNATWGDWIGFETDSVAPWSWLFTWPNGSGFYRFNTVAYDGSANVESSNENIEAIAAFDSDDPTSEITTLTDYWQTGNPMTIRANASDMTSGVVSVDLIYKYSKDNATWSTWLTFDTDITNGSWEWNFTWPKTNGFYQLSTRAKDLADNEAGNDSSPMMQYSYDTISPIIDDLTYYVGTTGDAFTFNASVVDNCQVSNAVIHYSMDNWSEAAMVGDGDGFFTFTMTMPSNSTSPIVYWIEAFDMAKNSRESTRDTVFVSDNDAPTADAGENQTVRMGDIVRFDGSNSTDNVGILNYSWTITNNETFAELYGVSPNVTFDSAGDYRVTLNVSDDGNWATDTITVHVDDMLDTTPPTANAGQDISGKVGETINFNGSASYDNVGIVNYTWTFEYNGTSVYLNGTFPEFIFWISGNITVQLTVTDAVGNSDTDELIIDISGEKIEKPQNWLVEYWWFLSAICITFVVLIIALASKKRNQQGYRKK
jgi:parallel beta-helix repeat protein